MREALYLFYFLKYLSLKLWPLTVHHPLVQVYITFKYKPGGFRSKDLKYKLIIASGNSKKFADIISNSEKMTYLKRQIKCIYLKKCLSIFFFKYVHLFVFLD